MKLHVKPAKYHNTPVEVDGIRFDSKAEAARYVQLKACLLYTSEYAISAGRHEYNYTRQQKRLAMKFLGEFSRVLYARPNIAR